MRNTTSTVVALTCTIMLFSSCLKQREGCTDQNAQNYDRLAKKDDGSCTYQTNYQTLAKDANVAENIFNDMFKTIDEESKNGQYSTEVGKTTMTYQSVVDTCAVITLNTNGGVFPMTLTIDFGAGCTDAYGVVRKGKIILQYTEHYTKPGAQVLVSVDNYYVNGYKVDGNKTITNNGRNGNGNLSYSVNVTNAIITKPDGGIITWKSTRTNEWIEGEGTNFWNSGLNGICDDTYLITGSGNGTTSDGQTYSITIVNPLKKKICCYWVVEGSISYEVNGNHLATIDYGNGTCDYNANLTYGNNTFVIVIQ